MEYSDLDGYPPILKRLARFLIENPEHLSRFKACELAGINKDSVRQATHRAKRKGKDFNDILRKIDNEKVTEFRPVVLAELQKQVLKGSLKAIEIFLRMSGDLKPDRVESNTTQSLCFLLPMPSTIENVIESSSENGHREGGSLAGMPVADD